MNEVIRVLNDSDIIHWALNGTLLGAVRHRGFIPHDDDVDIAILCRKHETIDSFEARVAECFERGSSDLILEPAFFGFKVKSRTYPMPHTNVGVDLFPYYQSGNQLLAKPDCIARWPREFFIVEETFPLRMIEFETLVLNSPARPWPFLDRVYGKRWYKEYKVAPPHYVSYIDIGIMHLTGYIQRVHPLPEHCTILAKHYQ